MSNTRRDKLSWLSEISRCRRFGQSLNNLSMSPSMSVGMCRRTMVASVDRVPA
eukprot:CAMPEP_0177261000 /NCGR_PEP_ID=MMETSP0367-20130122/59583_1 /TAXON_ID=447022 ORGANISM="Scrippsiella hangoei-like, Strain SHHI-4" /NCGR_SAMPLE_ID=MMETSP0367 /ASSEMBLY_ACC=CAM_ASM_000362 /LENGTH=52 /DNA_ID=CAMNT_0018715605 /DNA_START=39 /DNA_END=193 /DNA_ORIENTATION=+